MNLFRYLSLRKFEFLIGVLVFLLITILVIGSRQLRLAANDALVFNTPTVIQLDQSTNIDQLISILTESNSEFNEPEFRWATRLLG